MANPANPSTILWVNPPVGSDTDSSRTPSAAYGNRSFRTIAGAVASAQSGDTIWVYPGTYNENNLMKAGVSFHFMPGAKIDYTDPGAISSSTTSLLIGTGTKTLTVGASLKLNTGDFVSINLRPNTSDPDVGGNDWLTLAMWGTVISYIGTTLVANITNTAAGAGTYANWLIMGPAFGIFDDRAPGATGECTVSGSLEMTYRLSNPPNLYHSLGAVVSNSLTTKIKFHALKATLAAPLSMGGNTTFSVFSLKNVKDGSYVEMDEVTDSGDLWSDLNATGPVTTLSGGGGGFYWEQGELNIRCRRNTMKYGYALWCHEPNGGVSTNLYYRGDLISCTFACFYTDNNSVNYRVWIHALQMIGSGFGLSLIGPGKIYVDTQKLIADTVVSANSGVTLWLRAEKLTGTNLNNNGSKWLVVAGSTVYVTAQEYEDTGVVANGIDVSGASYLMVYGGRLRTGSNAASAGAVRHQGGVTRLMNVLIDGTANNNAINRPVVAAGAGLHIHNSVIVAAALASASIYAASAQTVKLYNVIYSNIAKDANVTLQANLGTLVVDAAVTA